MGKNRGERKENRSGFGAADVKETALDDEGNEEGGVFELPVCFSIFSHNCLPPSNVVPE